VRQSGRGGNRKKGTPVSSGRERVGTPPGKKKNGPSQEKKEETRRQASILSKRKRKKHFETVFYSCGEGEKKSEFLNIYKS